MPFLKHLSATHWRILAVIVIALVWIGSLWPSVNVPVMRFAHADKLQHFFAYAVIAFLLCRGWPRLGNHWLWLVAVLCGGAAEIGQAVFTTARHPDWWDMLANALGAVAGVLVARLTAARASRLPDAGE